MPGVASGISTVRSDSMRDCPLMTGSALHCPGLGSNYGLSLLVLSAASRRQQHKTDQQAVQNNSRDLPVYVCRMSLLQKDQCKDDFFATGGESGRCRRPFLA